MNKNGSILFEMIIYVTLSAGLVLLFFNGLIAFSSVYLQQMSIVMKSTSIHLMSDLFYRDIVQSSQILSNSIPSNCIVFRHATNDVGWLHDQKKRLCRVTGVYDPISQSWTSVQKSIVLPLLDTFTCTWHKIEQDTIYLTYIMSHNGSSVEQAVYLCENAHV